MAKRSNRPRLKRLLDKWAPIIKIQDWSIDIRYLRAKDWPKSEEGNEAYITYTSSLREASIYLLDPLDYDPGVVVDIEVTLVHELVHIAMHWASFSEGDPNYLPWEQSVDSLAKALIKLDRGE